MRVSLHCQGCAGRVKKHLSKMEGICFSNLGSKNNIIPSFPYISFSFLFFYFSLTIITNFILLYVRYMFYNLEFSKDSAHDIFWNFKRILFVKFFKNINFQNTTEGWLIELVKINVYFANQYHCKPWGNDLISHGLGT